MRLGRWAAAALAGVIVVAGAWWAAARWWPQALVSTGLAHRVVLYFADEQALRLVPEVRYVPAWRDRPVDRLRLLAGGPRSGGLAPVIPPGARPLLVRVDNGLAVADFSREIVERHWGGSSGELMTVYGIVNTLADFPGVRQVRILVEGKPVETLAGHVDLSQPLTPDLSLVRPPDTRGAALGRVTRVLPDS